MTGNPASSTSFDLRESETASLSPAPNAVWSPENSHSDIRSTEEGTSIHSSDEVERLRPMTTRLQALQIQQKLQGMDHPDVLFSLRGLSRAHIRRGELQQAQLVEEMILASHNNQRTAWNSSRQT